MNPALMINGRKRAVYGVSWDPTSTNPALTRTHRAVGLVANAGVDGSTPQNDFDYLGPWARMKRVVDDLGNIMVEVPPFWIRKDYSNPALYHKQISLCSLPGFYLPKCFYDSTGQVRPLRVGAYEAVLSAGKLCSTAGVFPTVNRDLVNFRADARANNVGGTTGYQLMDVHAYDALLTLFDIEFATHDGQSVVGGWTNGRRVDTDLVTVQTLAANTIVVANATAANYRVGEPIALGTSSAGTQRFYGRLIQSISEYDASNKAITVGGATFDSAVGNYLMHVAWLTGACSGVAASSGSPGSNIDGRHPYTWRGLENIFHGSAWMWVDGLNVKDNSLYVCNDPALYQSNVFDGVSYLLVGYTKATTNNYAKTMGHDPVNPAVEIPIAVDGSIANSRFRDYYYQSPPPSERAARVGGGWSGGSAAGPRYWALTYAPSFADVSIASRLLQKL